MTTLRRVFRRHNYVNSKFVHMNQREMSPYDYDVDDDERERSSGKVSQRFKI